MNILELIRSPWEWYVAGPMIALVMFLMLYFGKTFGFSTNLRTICSMAGAGKVADFFVWDWKAQKWNLTFVLGAILGGFVAHQWLMNSEEIELSAGAVKSLQELGFSNVGAQYLPSEIFGTAALSSPKGVFILLIGGILVGFGTRYAGGCTSGHSISGISNLQIPSIIATIGFFIGGLLMTYFGLPLIF